jgi:hypothetical protein
MRSGIPTKYDTLFFGEQKGVGVYASVDRPRSRCARATARARTPAGSRWRGSGNPLFTEGLVAFKDKDRFNRTSPMQDATFATYARNPELATLINAVYGTSFVPSGRTDLEKIFIPEVLRVVTTTAPVRLSGQTGLQPARVHRWRHDERRLGLAGPMAGGSAMTSSTSR